MTTEIEVASGYIRGTKLPNTIDFYQYSYVYKATNEQLWYCCKYFKDRKRLLSVIASSDQIFNAVLCGAREIEAFDISVFPQYVLYLKMASLKALTREEYVDFYYDRDCKKNYLDEKRKCKRYVNRILKYLEGDAKEFWQQLFSLFEWMSIYESYMFTDFTINLEKTIKRNPYLSQENYDKLRGAMSETSITTYTGNIVDLASTFKQENDLIYLSNIHNYLSVQEFLSLLNELNLSEGGIILAYIFKHMTNYREMFKDFYYDPITGKEGLMVHERRKQ